MLLDIHTSRVETTGSLHGYVERRIEFALGRFVDSIQRASVTLEDINGPRGGVDQLCRVCVYLNGHRQPVVAEATHEVLRAAIDIAAECAGRSVARTLDRKGRYRRGQRVVGEYEFSTTHAMV